MKFPINLAIKIVEMLIPDEYIGEVLESATEYILYPRFKDDDEWSDDEAYGVSKKTGRIREIGGEEGFMCNAPVVWKREKYSERGSRVI